MLVGTGVGVTALGSVEPSYASRVVNATAAPKEIGFLQRLEGVDAGLCEIEGRLRSFVARLAGQNALDSQPEPRACGVQATLETSEQRIRSILQLLGGLNDAF